MPPRHLSSIVTVAAARALGIVGPGSFAWAQTSAYTTNTFSFTFTDVNTTIVTTETTTTTSTTTDMPWGWPWWAYFLLICWAFWFCAFLLCAGFGPCVAGTRRRTKGPGRHITPPPAYEVVDEPDVEYMEGRMMTVPLATTTAVPYASAVVTEVPGSSFGPMAPVPMTPAYF
mmetsp:Transcript_63867/g.152319  ORF Transcript_63867/g.152319 Transcript_63867/m.152319 type:complete len:172 (+) Transcript_63867:57-572(+)